MKEVKFLSGKIYLTSDLHLGHDREFIWKVRGFNSVQQMNETIVETWNRTVDDDDDIYILGDVMLGGPDNIRYVERLRGRIHIVLGNHDTAKREEMYRNLPNVVEVAEVGIRLKYKKYHFYLSHYITLTGNLEAESLHQCFINLYGHTHQMSNFFNDMPFMYHVGVDSHDGYPVLLDDIIEEMYAKVKECIEFLDEPVEQDVKIDQSRCGKCVYEVLVCGENDFYGNCPKYKRDPPDGGFYG